MIKKYFKSLVSKSVDFVFKRRKRKARLSCLVALMSGKRNNITASIEASFHYGGMERSVGYVIDAVNGINQEIKIYAPVVIFVSIFITSVTQE